MGNLGSGGHEDVRSSSDVEKPAASEGVLVFRRLAGERGREVAEVFANAIEAAHEVHPGSWALTFDAEGGRVRLGTGKIAGVTLESGALELIVWRDEVPADEMSRAGWSTPGGDAPFKSLPDVMVVTAPLEVGLAAYPGLRAAHVKAVKHAAGGCSLSMWRRAHQPALVDEIERLPERAVPRPEYPAAGVDLAGALLALVNERFPDWQGAGDARFQEEETGYKRATVAKARELLGHDALRRLLDSGRFDEIVARLEQVGKDNNLLFHGVPTQGDLNILYQEHLDKEGFSRAVADLLYGPGEPQDRLDGYLRFVRDAGLPNKWTFPTYFLFMTHPEDEILVKPEVTRWLFRLAGWETAWSSKPSGEGYARVRELAHRIRRELAEYGVRDMVDVQSVMWVAADVQRELDARLVKPEKRDEFARLFDKFLRTHPGTEAGRQHVRAYAEARETFRPSFEEIVRRRAAGEDVTDDVLLKLLPHADTAHNRERGAWIHTAPVVTKDIKQWFEGAKWTRPGDWLAVAAGVLDLLVTCNDDPGKLDEACSRFASTVPSRGFQAAILSPALNALRPESFVIFNSKPQVVLAHFTGKKLTTDIAVYPEANRAVLAMIEELKPVLEEAPGLEELPLSDRFDFFCHWLKSVERFPFRAVGYWKIEPGQQGRLWEGCRDGQYVAMGWPEMGDLRGLQRKEFDEKAAQLISRHEEWTKADLEQLWKFARHVKEGDRIVANRGTTEVLGIGTVTGPYYFVEGEEYGHRLPVEWDDVTPRRVDRPGWQRPLIKLTREDFEEIAGLAPSKRAGAAGVSVAGAAQEPSPAGHSPQGSLIEPRAFELLAMLHENPKAEVYVEHRDEFREYLEEPFRRLFARLSRRLPAPMRDVLETEKGIMSRIRKNDWGRGGAWDHYWGAFYPKGGKRISSAQLFVWIDHDDFGYGFYMGESAKEQRRRFLRNCSVHRAELAEILSRQLEGMDLLFGSRSDAGPTRTGDPPQNVLEWLQDLERHGIHAGISLTKEQVTGMPAETLVESIQSAFERLFPLVLMAVEDDPMAAIRDYLEPEGSEDEEETEEEYTLAECAADLGVGEETVQRWVDAINRKGQIVLYGPPGTGKTFVAEHLARHLVSGQDGFVELVQFHPSYAYEDFIQGLRPEIREDGTLGYRLVPGRFLDFCRRASRRKGTCVLIVDEINRANLSRVFGELMYLLEYREREVPLAGGKTLRIPDNVRLIGTMNTADRSIALVDHALRRRFAFIALRPDIDVLRRFHAEKTGFDVNGLVGVLREVNETIGDPNYEVGISYFLTERLEEEIEDIWRMEIEPYLEEYFFDRPANVDQFRWAKVRERILGDG